ncbi:hypothetical protein HJG60_005159 [Phyllostomus discolor]|uniref:Uncharacterized protein n=1 Tax=Phyllostomus discolor TaxID=89673 RepID=A0A833YAF9_9CHIR|nr:hypothetical protein HJG60_005159 [Phyllostomus discolor]
MARLRLNMDSLDPLAGGDRDQPMDNQETPADTLSLPMGNLHTQDPTAVEEGKQVTVRSVTVKASQESLMDTQGPVMGSLDLNMDSLDPLAEGDRDLPRDNQETPADTLSLPMGNLHTQDPTAVEEGKQVTMRSVTVKASQESLMDTQGPVMARLDLNMDSLDPLAEGDRDQPTDNQETPADTLSLPMGNLHTQDPTVVEEGKQVKVMSVTVKASQESIMDTQGPVMARLDLNMDSLDPLAGGDRDQPMDNQETPADTLSLPMGNLHTQDPTAVEEGKQVTVRSVTVKASQ